MERDSNQLRRAANQRRGGIARIGFARTDGIRFLTGTLALLCLQCAGTSTAQVPQSPWGGYAVSAAVPYQPSVLAPTCVPPSNLSPATCAPIVTVDQAPLPGAIPNVSTPAAQTLAGPVVIGPAPGSGTDGNQVWQSYPAPGGVVPAGNPALPLQDPIYPPTPEPVDSKSLIPPGSRDGVFQKVNFTATYLPQLESDSLGWTDLGGDVVFGLPLITRETPLVITPSYEAHLLDRPANLDLPPRLHDIAVEFHHFRRIAENWIADIAVTPGLYADDHSFDRSDAVRITGRGLAIYESSPFTKWVMGVAYLDGAGWEIVPVGGVVYEPNDDVSYELVFPRPKISWRLPSSPVPGIDERWFYVGAEFGSGIWAIEYSDGTPDVFVSRDYRVLIGYERKIIGGLSRRIEAGYVFKREIELESMPNDINLDDTLMVRVGLTY